MVEPVAVLVGSVFVLVGGIVVQNARTTYDRYETADDLTDASDDGVNETGPTTVRGRVRVRSPANPDREPPDESVQGEGQPALWAWRVRRRVNEGGEYGGNGWKTIDGGLAVGEFVISHEWDEVRVRMADVAADQIDDPFDSASLYLDEPETEVYLGDLDPINRLFEKWGLAGPDGIVSDLEFNVSIGRKTTMPDRYQATVVEDGDELLVRGELQETTEGPIVRGTDDTPLLL